MRKRTIIRSSAPFAWAQQKQNAQKLCVPITTSASTIITELAPGVYAQDTAFQNRISYRDNGAVR